MQQLSLAQRLQSLLPTALPKLVPKRLSIGGSKSTDSTITLIGSLILNTFTCYSLVAQLHLISWIHLLSEV